MSDTLQKFMFEHSLVRGELVELSDAWSHVLARRSYPAAVSAVLGEIGKAEVFGELGILLGGEGRQTAASQLSVTQRQGQVLQALDAGIRHILQRLAGVFRLQR